MKNKTSIITLIIIMITVICASCISVNNDKDIEKPYVPLVVTSNEVNLSQYKIVIPAEASGSVQFAAQELQAYIEKSTSITVEIVTDTNSKQGHEILIGQTNRDKQSSIDYESLGAEGYALKVLNKDLFIAGSDERGALYGVYSFLEVLGYRFYSKQVEFIPEASSVFVPRELDVTFMPINEYREVMFLDAWDAGFSAKQKINSYFMREKLTADSKYGGTVGYVYGGHGLVHTMSYLLPSSYFSTNPEYFAVRNGSRTTDQICLTNEGAADVVYETALDWIKMYPKQNIISISQNDNENYCDCENCSESYANYGKSGTMINFVNKLAEKINKLYPNMKVDTLSYGYTSELPKGGVKPAKNVIIRLCTEMCQTHTDPEKCDTLKHEMKRIEDWSEICDELYVWFYTANYLDFFSIFPNYQSIYYSLNFFSKNNVKGIYNEGFGYESGEFGELKSYILAKLSWNPSMTKSEYEYHINDFLNGFYGKGGKYIKEYITLTENVILENDKELVSLIETSDYLPIIYDRQTKQFDLTLINTFNDLWDKAESQFSSQAELERIKKSRISVTYYELYNTMTERYSNGDTTVKNQLKERCQDLYFTMKKHNVMQKIAIQSINPNIIYFNISPKYW